MFKGQPPQNIDAEKAIIGSILKDNESIYQILEIIETNHFYSSGNRKIFKIILEMESIGNPIDLITLSNKVKVENIAYYLTECIELVPSTANIQQHAIIIKEAYLLRMIMQKSIEAYNKAVAKENPEEILEDLSRLSILSVQKQEDLILSEMLHQTNNYIDRVVSGEIAGLKTGIDCLDKYIGGMMEGDLIVIAGWTSQGKTALMLQILCDCIIRQKKKGLLFSMEMDFKKIIVRIIAQEAKINAAHYLMGRLDQMEWQRAARSQDKLMEMALAIDDTPGITLEHIKAKARKYKREGISVIGIDYLQLMQMPKAESDVKALGMITTGLKNLARELGIVIILLSQFSRQEKFNTNPRVSFLKGSSCIEQDSDKIIFTWMPNLAEKEKACLILAKHRDGETTERPLDVMFRKDWVMFVDKRF